MVKENHSPPRFVAHESTVGCRVGADSGGRAPRGKTPACSCPRRTGAGATFRLTPCTVALRMSNRYAACVCRHRVSGPTWHIPMHNAPDCNGAARGSRALRAATHGVKRWIRSMAGMLSRDSNHLRPESAPARLSCILPRTSQNTAAAISAPHGPYGPGAQSDDIRPPCDAARTLL